MGRPNEQFVAWTACRGRDGWSAPQDIQPDMAAEAVNVHFYDGGLCTKRGGSTSTGTLTGFTGPFNAMASWVPGQTATARELFVVDSTGTTKIGRMAAGSSLSALTLKDNVASSPTVVSFASLNGKLFISYDSTVNRLQVFAPGLSTTAIRRVALATPAAPTGANTGSGSYGAVLRYYRIAWTEQRSSVTVRRSLLGPSLSFTPSGSGTHVRITQPTVASEGETHWEVYGSSDDVTYYGPIATTAIGTTTYDDNATVTTYATTYDLAPVEGENTPFPSVKFLYSNGVRLFGLGVWETAAGNSHTPQAGTVYLSPALDSSGIHDEERCRNTVNAVGRVLLSRNAGGIDRGIAGLGNMIIAFQDAAIFALTPTENADTPYRRVQYSDSIGAVSHQSIIKAEDELGRPCLYFLDPVKGPYKLGQDGLRWVGKDVKDVWDTVSLGATNVVAHGLYHPQKRQVWFWIATGTNDPDEMLVLNVTEQRADEDGDLRGGWVRWTGGLAACRSSCLMANTLGASMSLDLKPYASPATGTVLLIADTSDATDNTVAFQGYLKSGAITLDPIVQHKQMLRSYLLAEAASGVTIRQTLTRNFGDETARTADALLTAAGSETRVLKAIDGEVQDAFLFQVQLGDSAAASATWTLDRWYGALEPNEVR